MTPTAARRCARWRVCVGIMKTGWTTALERALTNFPRTNTGWRRWTMTGLLVLMLSASASSTYGQALGVVSAQDLPSRDTAGAVLVQPDGVDAPAWGPAATSRLSISAYLFQSWNSSPISNVGPFNRFSGTDMVAAVQLPTGALITGMELTGCDSNASGEVVFGMVRVNPNGTFSFVIPQATTGVAATPGCATFSVSIAPHTVDNSMPYLAMVLAAGTNVSLNSVRVRYRLQVSPPPGAATFTDVPVGHPQRQFIEALFASGITGGCGGGNYCPNDPLTRGQMAVFLAAALGLHFPN